MTPPTGHAAGPPIKPDFPLQVNSPEDLERIIQTVVESTARIIVVFSSDVDLSPLVSQLLRHNVTNRTWIASEAWVTSALVLKPGVSSWNQASEPGLRTKPRNQASDSGLGQRPRYQTSPF